MLPKKRLSWLQKINVAYCKWYHGFDSPMDVFVTLEVIPDKPKPEPLEVNSKVEYPNRCLSERMTEGNNYKDHTLLIPNAFVLSLGADLPKVWIYNVSAVSQEVLRVGFGTMKIPANKSGRYTVVTSIPGVIKTPKSNTDNNLVDFLLEDGRRVAMDMINPENLGLDQDEKCNPHDPTETYPWSISRGQNLGNKGVFWSLSNPPAEEEIAAAYRRMEGWYKGILEEAYMGFKEKLTPELHAASEYYQITSNLQPVLERKY